MEGDWVTNPSVRHNGADQSHLFSSTPVVCQLPASRCLAQPCLTLASWVKIVVKQWDENSVEGFSQ